MDIFKAVEYGNLKELKCLVEKGANVNAKNNDSDTPLILASYKGSLEIVKYLVENGADLEIKDYYGGETPLIWASQYGHLETVKYLVEKGADINAKDKYGYTPLIWASQSGNLEIVKYLVKKGADLKAKNSHGYTPLIVASYCKQLEIVNYLVENGANLEAKNIYGKIAYDYYNLEILYPENYNSKPTKIYHDEKCCVCYEFFSVDIKEVVLNRCGHTLCDSCVPKIKSCPKCKMEFTSVFY